MEQIEKQRQEMIVKLLDEQKDVLTSVEPKEKSETEEERNIEIKDVMNKSLEELEAERDAILQQVRNPDPPSVIRNSEITKSNELDFSRNKKIDDISEIKKQKKNKNFDVNGDVLRLKTPSESSTGESSPCSQVSIY